MRVLEIVGPFVLIAALAFVVGRHARGPRSPYEEFRTVIHIMMISLGLVMLVSWRHEGWFSILSIVITLMYAVMLPLYAMNWRGWGRWLWEIGLRRRSVESYPGPAENPLGWVVIGLSVVAITSVIARIARAIA